jgi:hypothetical protein
MKRGVKIPRGARLDTLTARLNAWMDEGLALVKEIQDREAKVAQFETKILSTIANLKGD